MKNKSLIALLPAFRRRASLARAAFNVWNRGGWEQGGYVMDTATSIVVPPSALIGAGAVYTATVGAVTGTYMQRKTAAGATSQAAIPFAPFQNSVGLKGCYVKSLDFWWILGTAAFTTFAAIVRHATFPANAAAYAAVVNEAFAYDTFHATASNRITVAQHMMTLTPTTPWWLSNTDQLFVELTLVDPGTSVFDFYGARGNYTFRI